MHTLQPPQLCGRLLNRMAPTDTKLVLQIKENGDKSCLQCHVTTDVYVAIFYSSTGLTKIKILNYKTFKSKLIEQLYTEMILAQ